LTALQTKVDATLDMRGFDEDFRAALEDLSVSQARFRECPPPPPGVGRTKIITPSHKKHEWQSFSHKNTNRKAFFRHRSVRDAAGGRSEPPKRLSQHFKCHFEIFVFPPT
jgi:hypothetical protein